MSYNYTREYQKWKTWKDKEQQLLYELGVDESIIKQLYEYDYQMFLAERRIKRKQTVTLDSFFLKMPYHNKFEIRTIDDLLDNIENEALFAYLSKSDPKTLMILLLKILGYSIAEISKIMGINEAAIYGRIHRLKKKLKKIYK
ncbi:MAG: sigma factor-like helix-turn-helix DNA-binding protein [Longicatena sp.]